jgi:hypothetical protein
MTDAERQQFIVAVMKTRIALLHRQPQLARRCQLLAGCLTALLLFSVGCKPESDSAGDAQDAAINPIGTYSLVSVDGKPVPCQVIHNGHTMVITSGRFLIHADGTCQSQMFLEGRDAGIEVTATYTRAGSTLTMKWRGAGTTIGSIEGDTFTMNNEGMVLAYRRQMGSASEPFHE